MLAERLEELEKGKESRVAVVGETKRKKKSSAMKKSKRKYRLLEEAKGKEDGLSEREGGNRTAGSEDANRNDVGSKRGPGEAS